jgi:ABC-type branched-subunit amino acid transport system substrate-binding protein
VKFPIGTGWLGAALVAAVVLAGSAWQVVPQFRTTVIKTSKTIGGTGGGQTTQDATGPGAQNAGKTAGGTAVPPGLQCAAGRNGGATDVGITGDTINLASTVAESGPGSAFLGDARYGMLAIINAVNRQGGICGRRLNLNVVDDAWDPSTGHQDIRNFIAEKYFALAVVPSSEGLDASSIPPNGSNDIDRAGIPVVGTDGMLISQYNDPWIWPVASSTISTAHIAAMQGYRAGSRSFGIVWDKRYKFGQEGEKAFDAAVRRLGGNVAVDVPVDPDKQDYSPDVQTFESGCHPCDYTFMLLEPDTAIAWINSDKSAGHYIFGAKETSGPQPLFVSTFGQQCGSLCNNMWVWTGFQAPWPPFDQDPAVANFVNAIHGISASADTSNQFLEGAYVGMELLVKALQQVGPYVTRARLKQVLDSMTFDSGVTQPLSWSAGQHFANTSMLGFTIQYSGGFNGFQYQNTGWIKDPWVGRDQ